MVNGKAHFVLKKNFFFILTRNNNNTVSIGVVDDDDDAPALRNTKTHSQSPGEVCTYKPYDLQKTTCLTHICSVEVRLRV